MNAPASTRHLKIAGIMVLAVLCVGTVGYMIIEHLSFVDALYTAVDMMATTGSVVSPISPHGRIFTIFIIVFGVGALLYLFGASMEYMLEGHFNLAVRRYMMDKKISALRGHAIICGFGRVGLEIAKNLLSSRSPFIVIDSDETNVQACIQLGYLAVLGDATYDSILREAGIEHARCVLVATDNDAHNISITLSARNLNARLFIVARANHTETEPKLKLAGADRVLSPYTIGGRRMATLALQPTVIEFFDSLTTDVNPELSVREIKLASTSTFIGKTIAQVQNTLPDGIVFVALKKKHGLLIGPGRDVVIEHGDTIILVGVPEQLLLFHDEHSS
jgi:K+ transport systems, NAD-binding component